MEEKLIQFETAKIAKARGFNIVCKTGYHGDFGDLKGDDYPFLGTYSFLKDYPCNNKEEHQIAAPTQALLQKWFREVHSLDIEPEKYQHNEDGRYYKCRVWGEEFENAGYVTGFDSYEEALEEGLLAALAAIEIKN